MVFSLELHLQGYRARVERRRIQNISRIFEGPANVRGRVLNLARHNAFLRVATFTSEPILSMSYAFGFTLAFADARAVGSQPRRFQSLIVWAHRITSHFYLT